MRLLCLDLEGVLIPEIWINFAQKTGIDALRATTRDVPDYDELMRRRLRILDEHHLGLPDVQEVIRGLEPLAGARAFLDELRAQYQVVILSDTFAEFADPLMSQLGRPTLFCHNLKTEDNGRISDYCLRLKDHKRKAVAAFRSLNFTVVAAGDSYNDTTMLAEANAGLLFRAPDNVRQEFPQYPHCTGYEEFRELIEQCFADCGA